MTSKDTILAKREVGIKEIIENIKKRPNLPYGEERQKSLNPYLWKERTKR